MCVLHLGCTCVQLYYISLTVIIMNLATIISNCRLMGCTAIFYINVCGPKMKTFLELSS